MRLHIKTFLASLLFLPLTLSGASAHDGVAASIRHAYLIDVTHDAVLLDRNAQTRIPPASMSKLFTHLMLFERLGEGRLTVEDTFTVSERAWRMRGSRSFLDVNSQVRIQDLMLGLAVQSGNDAAVAIAEGLFGSEELFATEATRRLGELGIVNTTVRNASGLPGEGHLTTVEDLALAARHILRNHPQHYWIFGVSEFTWNNITQLNRNSLLGRGNVDGMKTGWTSEAGYGLVASAERDGRRLVGVVAGAATPQEREVAMAEMLNWGFAAFDVADPCAGFQWQVAIENAPVESVTLAPAVGCPVLVENAARDFTTRVEGGATLQAPVERGAVAGGLVAENEAGLVLRRELLVGESIPALTFVERLRRFVGL